MSDSDRKIDHPALTLAVMALLLIFFMIGFFSGQENGRSGAAEINAKIHHENAADQIQDSCIGLFGVGLRECVQNAIKTSGEYQRAEYDLAAQQEVAGWTKWVFFVSIAGMLFTIIGIYYVRKTFGETRETNKITREIGEAQVRAYLACTKVSYAIGDAAVNLSIELKNTGQTPASNIYLAGSVLLEFWPNGGAYFSGEHIESYVCNNVYQPIAANSEATMPYGVFISLEFGFGQNPANTTPEKILTYQRANMIEYVIDVTWRDVFQKWHTFEVRGRARIKVDVIDAVRDRQYNDSIGFTQRDTKFDVEAPINRNMLGARKH
jgi:hypothetical protein